ncbi:hypothetical protein CEXT_479431 [Caerostris extrusa]|uniref:Uncharacterized protein n=1 Tax=Caerostris extrusa TaxID=172846 RepID=A0AAV4MH15_CAEEX|nr:hypothetical protein CEXT_479431 [Caerostris extrusa]
MASPAPLNQSDIRFACRTPLAAMAILTSSAHVPETPLRTPSNCRSLPHHQRTVNKHGIENKPLGSRVAPPGRGKAITSLSNPSRVWTTAVVKGVTECATLRYNPYQP